MQQPEQVSAAENPVTATFGQVSLGPSTDRGLAPPLLPKPTLPTGPDVLQNTLPPCNHPRGEHALSTCSPPALDPGLDTAPVCSPPSLPTVTTDRDEPDLASEVLSFPVQTTPDVLSAREGRPSPPSLSAADFRLSPTADQTDLWSAADHLTPIPSAAGNCATPAVASATNSRGPAQIDLGRLLLIKTMVSPPVNAISRGPAQIELGRPLLIKTMVPPPVNAISRDPAQIDLGRPLLIKTMVSPPVNAISRGPAQIDLGRPLLIKTVVFPPETTVSRGPAQIDLGRPLPIKPFLNAASACFTPSALANMPFETITGAELSRMLPALQVAPIDAAAGTESSRMLATPQKISIDAVTAPSPSSMLPALQVAPIDRRCCWDGSFPHARHAAENSDRRRHCTEPFQHAPRAAGGSDRRCCRNGTFPHARHAAETSDRRPLGTEPFQHAPRAAGGSDRRCCRNGTFPHARHAAENSDRRPLGTRPFQHASRAAGCSDRRCCWDSTFPHARHAAENSDRRRHCTEPSQHALRTAGCSDRQTAGTEAPRMLATPQKLPIIIPTAKTLSGKLPALQEAPADASAGTEFSCRTVTPRNAAADGKGPPRRHTPPQTNANKPRSTSKASRTPPALLKFRQPPALQQTRETNSHSQPPRREGLIEPTRPDPVSPKLKVEPRQQPPEAKLTRTSLQVEHAPRDPADANLGAMRTDDQSRTRPEFQRATASTGTIPSTQVTPTAKTCISGLRALDATSITGPLLGTVQYKDRSGNWYRSDVRASPQQVPEIIFQGLNEGPPSLFLNTYATNCALLASTTTRLPQVFFRHATTTAAGKVVTTPAPGIRLRLFPTGLKAATDIEPKPCVPDTSSPPWDVDGTSFEDQSRRIFFSAGMKAATVLLPTTRAPVKSVNPDSVPLVPLAGNAVQPLETRRATSRHPSAVITASMSKVAVISVTAGEDHDTSPAEPDTVPASLPCISTHDDQRRRNWRHARRLAGPDASRRQIQRHLGVILVLDEQATTPASPGGVVLAAPADPDTPPASGDTASMQIPQPVQDSSSPFTPIVQALFDTWSVQSAPDPVPMALQAVALVFPGHTQTHRTSSLTDPLAETKDEPDLATPPVKGSELLVAKHNHAAREPASKHSPPDSAHPSKAPIQILVPSDPRTDPAETPARQPAAGQSYNGYSGEMLVSTNAMHLHDALLEEPGYWLHKPVSENRHTGQMEQPPLTQSAPAPLHQPLPFEILMPMETESERIRRIELRSAWWRSPASLKKRRFTVGHRNTPPCKIKHRKERKETPARQASPPRTCDLRRVAYAIRWEIKEFREGRRLSPGLSRRTRAVTRATARTARKAEYADKGSSPSPSFAFSRPWVSPSDPGPSKDESKGIVPVTQLSGTELLDMSSPPKDETDESLEESPEMSTNKTSPEAPSVPPVPDPAIKDKDLPLGTFVTADDETLLFDFRVKATTCLTQAMQQSGPWVPDERTSAHPSWAPEHVLIQLSSDPSDSVIVLRSIVDGAMFEDDFGELALGPNIIAAHDLLMSDGLEVLRADDTWAGAIRTVTGAIIRLKHLDPSDWPQLPPPMLRHLRQLDTSGPSLRANTMTFVQADWFNPCPAWSAWIASGSVPADEPASCFDPVVELRLTMAGLTVPDHLAHITAHRANVLEPSTPRTFLQQTPWPWLYEGIHPVGWSPPQPTQVSSNDAAPASTMDTPAGAPVFLPVTPVASAPSMMTSSPPANAPRISGEQIDAAPIGDGPMDLDTPGPGVEPVPRPPGAEPGVTSLLTPSLVDSLTGGVASPTSPGFRPLARGPQLGAPARVSDRSGLASDPSPQSVAGATRSSPAQPERSDAVPPATPAAGVLQWPSAAARPASALEGHSDSRNVLPPAEPFLNATPGRLEVAPAMNPLPSTGPSAAPTTETPTERTSATASLATDNTRPNQPSSSQPSGTSGNRPSDNATRPAFTLVLDPRVGVVPSFTAASRPYFSQTPHPEPHRGMTTTCYAVQIGSETTDRILMPMPLGVEVTPDGTACRVPILDLLAYDPVLITGGTPDGPSWPGCLILLGGSTFALRPATLDDCPDDLQSLATLRCLDVFPTRSGTASTTHAVKTRWTTVDDEWSALDSVARRGRHRLQPYNEEVMARLQAAGISHHDHDRHLNRRDWLNVTPEHFTICKLGADPFDSRRNSPRGRRDSSPGGSSTGAKRHRSESDSSSRRNHVARPGGSGHRGARSDRAPARTTSPSHVPQRSSHERDRHRGSHSPRASPSRPIRLPPDPSAVNEPLSTWARALSPHATGDQAAAAQDTRSESPDNELDLENSMSPVPDFLELQRTNPYLCCAKVFGTEPPVLSEGHRGDRWNILYGRDPATGNIPFDYWVLINGQKWKRVTKLPGMAGDDHCTLPELEDLIFLQPCDPQINMTDPSVLLAVHRVIHDLGHCNRRLGTYDQLVAVTAVFRCWSVRDSPQQHMQLSSEQWVDTYLELIGSEGRSPGTSPNCNGRLRLLLLRDGIPPGTLDPDGNAVVPRDYSRAPYTAAELNIFEDHRVAREHALHRQTQDRGFGNEVYVFTKNHSRENSCIKNPTGFIPYNGPQAAYMGMVAPNDDKPYHLREIPGYVTIMINDEPCIIHGVWFCESYSDNVIVWSHFVISSHWWLRRTESCLCGPSGIQYRVLHCDRQWLAGLDVGLDQVPFTLILRLKMGLPLTTIVDQPIIAAVPRPTVGSWGLRPMPIAVTDLPHELQIRSFASDVGSTEVLAFLQPHTEATTGVAKYPILSGFLEQPAVRPIDPKTKLAYQLYARECVLPDVPTDDNELRKWSVTNVSHFRPSPAAFDVRRAQHCGLLSIDQRDRGEDTLPSISEPRIRTERVTITNPTTGSNELIDAAFSGHDGYAYISRQAAHEIHLPPDTGPTLKFLITEIWSSPTGVSVSLPIVGTVELEVKRGHRNAVPERFRCMVFDPGTCRCPRIFLPTEHRRQQRPAQGRPHGSVSSRLALGPSTGPGPTPADATIRGATAPQGGVPRNELFSRSGASNRRDVVGSLSAPLAALSMLPHACALPVHMGAHASAFALAPPWLAVAAIFATFSVLMMVMIHGHQDRFTTSSDSVAAAADSDHDGSMDTDPHGYHSSEDYSDTWVDLFAADKTPRIRLSYDLHEHSHLNADCEDIVEVLDPPKPTQLELPPLPEDLDWATFRLRLTPTSFWFQPVILSFEFRVRGKRPLHERDAILRAAGIEPQAMAAWVRSYILPSGRIPHWLMINLSHVKYHHEAPQVCLHSSMEVLPSPVDDAPPRRMHHRVQVATSLSRVNGGAMASIRVASMGLDFTGETIVQSRMDPLASFPMMSRSCAISLFGDLELLGDLREAQSAKIFELLRSPGGPYTLSDDQHYTVYWALKMPYIRVSLTPCNQPPIWFTVRVLVFENRTLLPGSCFDMVWPASCNPHSEVPSPAEPGGNHLQWRNDIGVARNHICVARLHDDEFHNIQRHLAHTEDRLIASFACSPRTPRNRHDLTWARHVGNLPANERTFQRDASESPHHAGTASPPQGPPPPRRSVNGLYLNLPLSAGQPTTLPPGVANFLPRDSRLNYATLNHTVGDQILQLANLSQRDMAHWVRRQLSDDDVIPRWLLFNLIHIVDHRHLPALDPRPDYDSSSDEEAIHSPHAPTVPVNRACSSLSRRFPSPAVRVEVAGRLLPSSPRPSLNLERSPSVVVFVDLQASCPMMSRSCAVRHGIDVSALDTSRAGQVCELYRSPGDLHLLSLHPHHTLWWALGGVWVQLNFGSIDAPPEWLHIDVVIIEDRGLPRNTCVDLVLHRAFADAHPAAVRHAARSDRRSQSLSDTASASSFTAAVRSEPKGDQAVPTARDTPSGRPTHDCTFALRVALPPTLRWCVVNHRLG
ncbi:hypothetical protein T484DRAFT_3649185 [Baffinella frigidus]|nr:hypothetical protein T484DRAFT_3649185 [Cryptophyta sp. CCMP2293]